MIVLRVFMFFSIMTIAIITIGCEEIEKNNKTKNRDIAIQKEQIDVYEIDPFIDYGTIYNFNRVSVRDYNYTPCKLYNFDYAEARFEKDRIVVVIGQNTYQSRIIEQNFMGERYGGDFKTYKKAEITTEDGLAVFSLYESSLIGRIPRLSWTYGNLNIELRNVY